MHLPYGLGALPPNESRYAFPDGKLTYPDMGGAVTRTFSQESALPQWRVYENGVTNLSLTYKNLPRATPAQTGGIEFPFTIKNPYITSNLEWWRGPLVNAGSPRYSNDPDEYLRSAMIESDWAAVKNWLGWKFAVLLKSGSVVSVGDFLATFNFGVYKWAGTSTKRTYFPFSKIDYQSFFTEFKRMESGAQATKGCIESSVANYMQLFATVIKSFSGTTPASLVMGACSKDIGWMRGIMNAVGLLAAFVGVVYAAGLIAASTAASGTVSAGALTGEAAGAAATGATGAGVSAGAASAATGAGILETISVTATALPVLSPLAAGAIAAGIAAPIIAAGSASAPASNVLETIEVQATRAPPVTPGQIATGLINVATNLPATVNNPSQVDVPKDAQPQAEEPPPKTTLATRFLDALKELIKKYGGDILRQQLEQYLMRQLTQDELDYLDYLEDHPGTPIQSGTGVDWSTLKQYAPWLLAGVVALIVLDDSKGKRKRSRKK